MKALIVDDSDLARQELKHLLKGADDVQVLGEADSADVAMEKILDLKPCCFSTYKCPEKQDSICSKSWKRCPK